MPVGTLAAMRPAPLAARLAALALDLVVGIGFAIVFGLAALIWLLWRSDGGLRQPSDLSIYFAMLLGSAWIPVWAAYSLHCWLRDGQTPGLAAMSLAVADRRGERADVGRGLVRLIGLAIGVTLSVSALIALLALIAAAAQGTLPARVALAGSLLVLAALAEPACCILSRRRLALHDLVSGTRVVRFVPPDQARQEFGNRVP